MEFSSVVSVVPTEQPGAVAAHGAGTGLSARDFIQSDDAEGFPGPWGADLSSKHPVAEADIGQYDWYEAGECEKRDYLCPMFGRCVPDVWDARNGVRPDTRAERGNHARRRRQAEIKGCKNEDRALLGLGLEFYDTNVIVSAVLINASETVR
ncbi:hypothetical protein [Bradyrhizobium ivorense]|uniref:hypothetical protein n=1 Tax=Bradyrhizobium ivorense TaxID=2511166 RepID=UPI00111EE52B|nr:hypothetical protein [Bradyrhizobium ivorense]